MLYFVVFLIGFLLSGRRDFGSLCFGSRCNPQSEEIRSDQELISDYKTLISNANP
jgi:hypothetical protein